jgi:hypothetical protein
MCIMPETAEAFQGRKIRPAGCAGGAVGKEFVTLLVIL